MNITGLLIGGAAFMIIGIFHPIVIKCEYYFTYKIWPVFLFLGAVALILSYLTKTVMASSLLGILGFTCLWSIIELKEQKERVNKGWFPQNPKRSGEKGEQKDSSEPAS